MPFSLSKLLPHRPAASATEGYVSVGYFPNWSIYQRGYKPADVPAETLTHILYAFANVNPDDGCVFLSDTWADQEIKYEGDKEEEGCDLYGNLKQFLLYKQQHRHLKLLLSIGGWTYSSNFPCLADPAKRARFVESAVKLLADNGLDGLDVDWEYPASDAEADAYVALLRALREGLDAYGHRATPHDPHYLLTVAAPCAPAKYETLHLAKMDAYLDFWNLMAYDFSGSWDQSANHQANLYGSSLSVDKSVQYYRSHGVHASKLVVGVPLYGRGFDGTQGPGAPYSAPAKGTLEAGTYSYRELPLQGAEELYDPKAGAAWSYDRQHGEMITYDSPQSASAKAEYIQRERLGGAMFWELSGDAASSARSLVALFHAKVGPATYPALSYGRKHQPSCVP